MTVRIKLERHRLIYQDGEHMLSVPMQWLCAPKTIDHPAEIEIDVSGVNMQWTMPQGKTMTPSDWENVLDKIADEFSRGPTADILGNNAALLRGVSRFRFYLNPYPYPSRYYEIGRYLEIPMINPRVLPAPKLVLDARGLQYWTEPREPLLPAKLEEILQRALNENPQIGVLRH